jgi:tyrosinase
MAPVFDAVYGFGGNGNISAPKSVAHGHCVTEGPFSNLQALYYGVENVTHCLSRSFVPDTEKRKEIGKNLSPQHLAEVLRTQDFDRFWERLELGPHNAVPQIIRGDFFDVTAPYGMSFLSISLLQSPCSESSA